MKNNFEKFGTRRAFAQSACTLAASLVGFRASAQSAAKPVARPSNESAAAPPAKPAASAIALPPLPYAQNSLEPSISGTTLSFHYGKHHKAYVEKTNDLVKGTPLQGKGLEEVVKGAAGGKGLGKLFNNSAQVFNHNVYWASMKPGGGGAPPADLKRLIDRDFGSYESFRTQFIQKALDHFSNGWVWLVNDAGKLKLVDTHDADTPLVHGQKPILVTDVWEHAYYLDYKNVRKDYVIAFVDKLLNWDYVRTNLA